MTTNFKQIKHGETKAWFVGVFTLSKWIGPAYCTAAGIRSSCDFCLQ